MAASPLDPLSHPIPVTWRRPLRRVETTFSLIKPVAPLAACVQRFAATASTPSRARRFTAETLARWRLDELTWPACQVVSELVTNVVTHAEEERLAPVQCRLTLKVFSDALAVEVWDPAVWQPAQAGCPSQLDETGRGLAIVEALCVAPPLVFNGPAIGTTIVALLASRTDSAFAFR
jgi:anti-sigma regulatory factor (Ser/Thr protein kinase)